LTFASCPISSYRIWIERFFRASSRPIAEKWLRNTMLDWLPTIFSQKNVELNDFLESFHKG